MMSAMGATQDIEAMPKDQDADADEDGRENRSRERASDA